MSRKPTIKISYPETSEKALLLTEAMVKRAPGKRVVETESEDPIFPDGGELFSGFIRCKTQTGVELTLTLNSSSMDYALETLIKPNLTADERKRILGDSASGDDLLPGSASAEEQTELELTPGEREKVDASVEQLANEHIIEPKKKIEIGKISDRDLRTILADLVDAAQGYVQGGQDAWEKHIENAIETAIKEIDHRTGVIDLDETYKKEEQIEIGKMEAVDLRRIITDLQDDMVNHRGDHIEIAHRAFDAICEAAHMTKHDFAVDTGEEEETSNTWLTAMLATLIHLASNSKASKKNQARGIAFEYLNREELGIPDNAQTSCAAVDKAIEAAYRIAEKINRKEPADVDEDELFERLLHEMNPVEYPAFDGENEEEEKQDGEIEPGLLNDLDDGSDGMASAEEVIGHDE